MGSVGWMDHVHFSIVLIIWRKSCIQLYSLQLWVNSKAYVAYWTVGQTRSRTYKKYNLYFYSSTATFVWIRNTVRESSHISSFCGSRRTHTEELTGLLEWPADFPFRLSDQWISAFNPKLQMLYCFSSPMRKYKHPLCLTYFLFVVSFRNLHISFFFPVICWSSMRTEISVILSTSNKLHFFSFLWNHFVDVILRPHWIS